MGGVGSGRKPREYPPEVVDEVCGLYLSGMTVAEVQAATPSGYKVQRILERYLPERRRAIKRDQRGPLNPSWRGDEAGYQALHLRVESARGKPSECSQCGATEGRFEWANLTGNYQDINDFVRLCVPCHRQMDANRRAITGRRTSPARR